MAKGYAASQATEMPQVVTAAVWGLLSQRLASLAIDVAAADIKADTTALVTSVSAALTACKAFLSAYHWYVQFDPTNKPPDAILAAIIDDWVTSPAPSVAGVDVGVKP